MKEKKTKLRSTLYKLQIKTLTYCSLSHIPHSCHSSSSWLHDSSTKWPNLLDCFYLNKK